MSRLVTYNEIQRRKIVRQGGLSDRLWNNPELRSYINSGFVYGYIGAFERTIRSDKVLMRIQKRYNIPDKALVERFLTNTNGRHCADGFVPQMSDEKMAERMISYML